MLDFVYNAAKISRYEMSISFDRGEEHHMKRYSISGIGIYDEYRYIKKLEKKAQKGWILETMNSGIETYTKQEPQVMHYYVEYCEKQKTRKEELIKQGYEYVGFIRNIRLYKSKEPLAPIYANEAAHYQAYKFSHTTTELVLSLALILLIAFYLIWSDHIFNISAFLKIASTDFFTINELCLLLYFTTFTLYRIAALQKYKALSLNKTSHVFLDIIKPIYIISFFLLVIVFVFYLFSPLF